MSDVAVAAPVVAPPITNGKAPPPKAAPAKAEAKPPAAPPVEVDDSEEFVVDGKPVRLNKAQRQLQIQKALAADKRLQEATERLKKLDEEEKLWESDPEAALAKRGKDPKKMIAEHLARQAKRELMTPEQIEREKIEKERDEAKGKLEAREKKEADERKAAFDKKSHLHIETELLASADKYAVDGRALALLDLLDVADEFVDYGLKIKGDEIAQIHLKREKEHIEARDKKLWDKLEGPPLLKYLGEKNVAKLRAALKEADAASLNDLPAPTLKPKVNVKAHQREVKGHIRENDFDKKFGL